ncbi:MAG: response regulator transcription factor [Gammaproteobacteria bacterium]
MKIDIENSIVYLVDDDNALRDALALLIESSGYQVKCYESAENFLDNFISQWPSCLVLDVRMPRMTGLELQEEMHKRNIEIPIIFISGQSNIPTSSKAFRSGAIDFLEKPLDNEIFLIRIQEAIDKDRKAREASTGRLALMERYRTLTPREQEVMTLLVKNNSNKEAARTLGISNRTVDVHRAHLMEKMHAKNLADLTLMAVTLEIL